MIEYWNVALVVLVNYKFVTMTEAQLVQAYEPSEFLQVADIADESIAPEPEPNKYKPHKVFLNHVDTYHAKHIAAHITDQIFGLTKLLNPVGMDEGAEAEELPSKVPVANMPTDKYEVIGTLNTPFKDKSEDVQYIVDESDENFKEEILKCGFVIYDITKYPSEIAKALATLAMIVEELEGVKKIGPKTYDSFTETKVFILISTVMTWGLTKPLDPDDPDLPFSEIDYRKRRPHPNYKQHYECEKQIIKTGQKYKDKLKTYVVCCGNVYGEEEGDLELFFKMAWYNEVLPVFDSGNNTVPFIHVRDLAKAMHGLMENVPHKPQYILAVEPTPSTLKQFMRSLSKALSDGKTTNVVAEEAFLYTNMTQNLFERCTVNLNMEPVFLVENLQLEWQSEMNVAENMIQIVEDFKRTRNLKPIKIILHGPPASGKTQLAKKLAEYYHSKYISVASMLEDYLAIWKDSVKRARDRKDEPQPQPELLGEEEIEPEEEEEEDIEQLTEQIREIEILMEGGIEKMPDDYVIGLLRSYLAKNFCQNRGYVLDGFPEITAQAKELFGQAENAGGGEEEEAVMVDPSKILPDLVVSLIACDEFLCERIMKLPEEEIQGSQYEEDAMIERLEKYRENNTEENTVLNYFDELEIDILFIEVKDDNDDEKCAIVAHKLGPPIGFGLSPEEEAELNRIEQEERRLVLEEQELNAQRLVEQAEQERKDKMELWAETLEKLKSEEEKILVVQSEPLRHYLMKYVFPILTKGLIEVATLKPDDPVDFLAEYLFKENPEGKMFDPSYNVECEGLYEEFRGYIEKIISENSAFEK